MKSIYTKCIAILLLIFFFYQLYQTQKEGFTSLQKYCLSADQSFIAISDDKDPRCLINQSTQNHVGPILNYLPCRTEAGTWGIQHLNTCYPISQATNEPQPSDTSTHSNIGFEYSGMESPSGLPINQKESKKEKLKEKTRKATCQDTRIPNSGPCFSLSQLPHSVSSKIQAIQQQFKIKESFDQMHKPTIYCNQKDLTLDEQCQCYVKDSRYGFYKVQTTGNQGSLLCRKYYKSQNNDITKLGKYSPKDYQIYVSTKPNSTQLNMSGCVPRDTDFNEMCAMQNKNDQFGSYQILYGEDGNCYDPTSNLPNPNYGNAICSQNHFANSPKLWPANIPLTSVSLSPNYFTKCVSMNSDMKNTFQNECDKIELSGVSLQAYEIDSYDCEPGEARAKCRYLS